MEEDTEFLGMTVRGMGSDSTIEHRTSEFVKGDLEIRHSVAGVTTMVISMRDVVLRATAHIRTPSDDQYRTPELGHIVVYPVPEHISTTFSVDANQYEMRFTDG